MKKQLSIVLVAISLNLVIAQEKITNNIKFIEESEAVCDAKDQSSAKALLQSIVACQNIGRNSELLSLMYLGTDENDHLFKGTSEELSQDTTVGLKANQQGIIDYIKLGDWRKNMKIALEEQDKAYDINTSPMMKLVSIGEFEVEENNLLPELGQDIKGGNIKFSGVNISDADDNVRESRMYIIEVNKKYYLFNLPI